MYCHGDVVFNAYPCDLTFNGMVRCSIAVCVPYIWYMVKVLVFATLGRDEDTEYSVKTIQNLKFPFNLRLCTKTILGRA